MTLFNPNMDKFIHRSGIIKSSQDEPVIRGKYPEPTLGVELGEINLAVAVAALVLC